MTSCVLVAGSLGSYVTVLVAYHCLQMSSTVKLGIAIQVAQALMFLHTSEPPTVHLDVKPSNILVGK